MTLREAILSATETLAAHPQAGPNADARRDAETLLLATLALPRTALYTAEHRELTSEEQTAFAASLTRRAAGEPLQYILGQQEFYGLPFRVTPATLIPRPETELLVESVLAEFTTRRDQPLKIADIGTGSGAIAISLAVNLPHATLYASDISREALRIAAENAATNGVADRIFFREGDLLVGFGMALEDGLHFDAVVSNPPYIPLSDLPTLEPQVRDHEPHTALFAGTDGLDLYRRLIPVAHATLAPGGLLAMEFGYGQREALATLLETPIGAAPLWSVPRFLDDLQGIPRVVLARMRE